MNSQGECEVEWVKKEHEHDYGFNRPIDKYFHNHKVNK